MSMTPVSTIVNYLWNTELSHAPNIFPVYEKQGELTLEEMSQIINKVVEAKSKALLGLVDASIGNIQIYHWQEKYQKLLQDPRYIQIRQIRQQRQLEFEAKLVKVFIEALRPQAEAYMNPQDPQRIFYRNILTGTIMGSEKKCTNSKNIRIFTADGKKLCNKQDMPKGKDGKLLFFPSKEASDPNTMNQEFQAALKQEIQPLVFLNMISSFSSST